MKTVKKTVLTSFVPQVTPRLSEWAAYHLCLGFERVVIAVPRTVARSSPYLEALDQVDGCEVVPVAPAEDTPLMRQAIQTLWETESVQAADWMLYLETTEFLCIHAGKGGLKDVCDAMPKAAHAVSIATRSFGTLSPGAALPRLVIEAQTEILPADQPVPVRQHLRCLFRPNAFEQFRPNRPLLAEASEEVVWCNGDGKVTEFAVADIGWRPKGDLNGTSVAQINNYLLASPGEYLMREMQQWSALEKTGTEQPEEPQAELRSLDGQLQDLQTLWLLHDHSGEKDTRAQSFVPQVEARLEAWRKAVADFEAAEAALWTSYQSDCRQRLASPLGEAFMNWLLQGKPTPALTPPRADATATPEAADKDTTDTQETQSDSSTEPDAEKNIPGQWFQDIYPGGAFRGSYERLENHALSLTERTRETLWISFDNLGPVRDTSFSRDPWAYKFIGDLGHSHLGVFARRKDWYRCPDFIKTLEHWAETKVTGKFEKVILTGSSMGAFAAMAFAPLFPGATVIAYSPQTTLDKTIVPWERRYGMGVNRDWTLPYNDAVIGVQAAALSYVFYDPYMELDRQHIARLSGGNIKIFKTWYSGHFPPVLLRRMERLKDVMKAASEARLEEDMFYKLYRDRRYLPWYQRALTERAEAHNHPQLASRIAPAFAALRQARQQQKKA